MNLLAAANYDPTGGAVSKVTTSLIAMTALDTTNLRLAFTVPAHGMVHVRMSGVHHGSTTTAQLFLGCLEGTTLRGRASPTPNLLGTAIATTRTKLEVAYTITGLTPGAATWDAAYGVEIVSSAGGAIKYGGPNNTTTDDAFGGFNFEIWDPRPIPTATPGAANGLFIAGTNAATTITTGLTTTFTGNLTGSVGSLTTNNDKTGYSLTAVTGLGNQTANITGNLSGSVGSVTGAVGSVTGLTAATVHADLDDIQARLPAALTAGGNMKADALAISGDTVAADNAESFFDGTGYAGTNNVIPTVTTVTNLTNAPTAGDLTATMKTSVENAVLNADMTGHQGQGSLGQAIGDPVGNTSSIYRAVVEDAVGSNIGYDTTSILSNLSALSSRLPAALSGDGYIMADLKSIDDELTDGNNATLNLAHLNIVNTTGNAITAFSFSPGSHGIAARATTGNGINATGSIGVNVYGLNQGVFLEGDSAGLLVYGDDGNAVEFQSFGTGTHGLSITGTGKSINAPQDIAVSDGDLTLANIANTTTDAVLDEAIAGHLIAGTVGDKINAAGAAGDPLSSLVPGAYGAGTAGFIIGNNVPDIKAKTDSLTFGVTNAVDANITHVIADPVQENGASDTEWGGTP